MNAVEFAPPPLSRMPALRLPAAVAAAPCWLRDVAVPAAVPGWQWLVPSSSALARAGGEAACTPAFWLRHLCPQPLALLRPGASVSLLDGSVLRRDAGGQLLDADDQPVTLLGQPAAWRMGTWQRVAQVLTPPRRSLRQRLADGSGLQAVADSWRASPWALLLDSAGPFTLFAAPGVGALGAHLLPGRWPLAALPWGETVRSVAGTPIRFGRRGDVAFDDGPPWLVDSTGGRSARNGVLHRLVALPSGGAHAQPVFSL